MIDLRPYQIEAVEALRAGIRAGHRCQILCAPTGSGKTVIGAFLLQEVLAKERRAAFIVDRVALCAQTSDVLLGYDIAHGVAQSQNTRGRGERIQVCSAQTIEKRGFWPDLDLLIVDEAHTMRRKVVEFIERLDVPVIGLTATPFSKGLGSVYSNVVNVTTTDQLIADGWLAPLKAYAATEIDMTGAKMSHGEWTDKEAGERGTKIVGDIVDEWADKTAKHFGGPVKTIAFSATVDHGAEMCRAFQAEGHDFRQISYRDRDDDARAELIAAFRAGEITGLVSCEALAKGFDVPDVLCLISARPYRKSLAAHIQQIGRAMRSSAGKDYALLLDHAGNYLGFLDQMLAFFANGVDVLDDDEMQNVTRKEDQKEKTDRACVECGFILGPEMDACPACGHERQRKSRIEHVAGEMREINPETKKPLDEWLHDRREVWRQICYLASERTYPDQTRRERFALAQYRTLYGGWPDWDYEPGEWCDPRVRSRVKSQIIRFMKRRDAA